MSEWPAAARPTGVSDAVATLMATSATLPPSPHAPAVAHDPAPNPSDPVVPADQPAPDVPQTVVAAEAAPTPEAATPPEEQDTPSWAARHVGWIWTACVVVVIALVAALGGFRARTDQRISLDAGTPAALGVAEVTVRDATARLAYGMWTVDVRADLTNTSDQPITAASLDAAIQIGYLNDAGAERTGQGKTSLTVLGGADGSQTTPRRVIPPGSGVVPVVLEFWISDGFRSDQGIRVGLYPVTYRDNTILGLPADKEWALDKAAADFRYWVVAPPLTITEG